MSEQRASTQQKTIIKRQAKGCCEYCWSQEDYSPDTFSVEHFIPLAKGGSTELDNLALACQGCNNRKYVSTEAIDPLTGEMAAFYHPRQDQWANHFAWNENYTLIIGISATGRATVDKLELNRKGVVNLRQVLRKLRLHPIEGMI